MAILWILINVVCTVSIRGHEANFYETEARCHEAEIKAEARKSEAEAEARKSEAEAEAEAEWFGLEVLTSLLYRPRSTHSLGHCRLCRFIGARAVRGERRADGADQRVPPTHRDAADPDRGAR